MRILGQIAKHVAQFVGAAALHWLLGTENRVDRGSERLRATDDEQHLAFGELKQQGLKPVLIWDLQILQLLMIHEQQKSYGPERQACDRERNHDRS